MEGSEMMTLAELAAGLDEHAGRIIVEGANGAQHRVARVLVIGAKTDDPGLIIRVVLP